MNFSGLGGFANGLIGGLKAGHQFAHERLQDEGTAIWGNTLAGLSKDMTSGNNPFASSDMSSGAPTNDSPVQPTGGYNPSDLPKAQQAIYKMESGGNYGAIGPATKTGDHAYGAAQVMGANIPAWTQDSIGHSEDAKTFLADHAAQDAVFRKHFGGDAAHYHSFNEAASRWFTGRGINAQSQRAKDSLGTSGASYVDKFQRGMNNTPPQPQMLNPQQGQQQRQQQPQGGGPMTLRSMAAAIYKYNPHATPAQIAVALEHALPAINSEGQRDYHTAMLGIMQNKNIANAGHQANQDRIKALEAADQAKHRGNQDRTSAVKAADLRDYREREIKARADALQSKKDQYAQTFGQRNLDNAKRLAVSQTRLGISLQRLKMDMNGKDATQQRASLRNAEQNLVSTTNSYTKLFQATQLGGSTPESQTELARIRLGIAQATQELVKTKSMMATSGGVRSENAPPASPTPAIQRAPAPIQAPQQPAQAAPAAPPSAASGAPVPQNAGPALVAGQIPPDIMAKAAQAGVQPQNVRHSPKGWVAWVGDGYVSLQ